MPSNIFDFKVLPRSAQTKRKNLSFMSKGYSSEALVRQKLFVAQTGN